MEARAHGAQPGLIIPPSPEVGMSYRQEHYAGEAEDRGRILSLDELIEVPVGSYDGVLMTKDWTPLEPGRRRAQVLCERRGADPRARSLGRRWARRADPPQPRLKYMRTSVPVEVVLYLDHVRQPTRDRQAASGRRERPRDRVAGEGISDPVARVVDVADEHSVRDPGTHASDVCCMAEDVRCDLSGSQLGVVDSVVGEPGAAGLGVDESANSSRISEVAVVGVLGRPGKGDVVDPLRERRGLR